ncbi:MAG: hypothetical protein ACE5RN_07410 [Nitrosopumilaceae archaeon]
MNIYDKKQIKCARCGSFVGEVEYDAKIIFPLCGNCADPYSDGFDKIQYSITRLKNVLSK